MNRVWVTLVICLSWTLSAVAVEVGDMVAFIEDTDLKVQFDVVDRVGMGEVCKVRAIDGDWLSVSRGISPGWTSRTATIPAEQAVDYFAKAIQNAPNDANLRYAMSNVCQWKGDFDAELSNLNAAIQLSPESNYLYLDRGTCWNRKGDYPKALADYAEYLQRGGDNDAIFRNNRGLVYQNQKQWDKAIADYDVAIQLNPKHMQAYSNRGDCYVQLKDYAKARADYTEVIRLDPTNIDAYRNRGSLWDNLPVTYESSRQDLSKVLELDPADPESHNGMAWFLCTCPDAKYRNGEKAFDYATKACELSQWKNSGIIDTLAAAYAECSDFASAIKYAVLAISIAPEEEKAGLRQHLELFRQGKPWRVGQK